MSQTILVVEDELHLAHGLKFNLEREGFEVIWASDGHQALKLFEESRPHLILLDLMIPGIEGGEVLRTLRERGHTTPVIILSAKNQDKDKVEGLGLGADDYLTKPFNLNELLLRIKNFLKRFAPAPVTVPQQEHVEFGKNRIHLRTYQVQNGDRTFYLTEQEMKLLRLFLARPQELISKRELLRDGWGYSEQIETRTLDIFMTRFRKYFEIDPKGPRHFVGQRGKGIIFYPHPEP